jgi:hypothetical protein
LKSAIACSRLAYRPNGHRLVSDAGYQKLK